MRGGGGGLWGGGGGPGGEQWPKVKELRLNRVRCVVPGLLRPGTGRTPLNGVPAVTEALRNVSGMPQPVPGCECLAWRYSRKLRHERPVYSLSLLLNSSQAPPALLLIC